MEQPDRSAVIIINYIHPDVNTYGGVVVFLENKKYFYFTGDVEYDFEQAIRNAIHDECTALVYHDTCNEFVQDSQELYAYDMNYLIVRIQSIEGV